MAGMDPFKITLNPGGFVYMQLIGSLDDKNFEALKVAVEGAKKMVRDEFDKQGHMVNVLFDLSEFTGTYNVGAMLAMKGLEEHNRPYVAKSAIFGGSPAAQVAAELTLALIGKDNLKLFGSRAEAEAWLKE